MFNISSSPKNLWLQLSGTTSQEQSKPFKRSRTKQKDVQSCLYFERIYIHVNIYIYICAVHIYYIYNYIGIFIF